MKQAIIDIGSNSIRLTLYEILSGEFNILFKEKVMAGLAAYVEKGKLSEEGMDVACASLSEFKKILNSLEIENISVFATASLRNIDNSDEAVQYIKINTGFDIAVLSGEEEAFLGYLGAMQEFSIKSGAFVDIGGASTEIISFDDFKPLESVSLKIGSLNLHHQFVKKIWPKQDAVTDIDEAISAEISQSSSIEFKKRSPLVCVGGTARAVLEVYRKFHRLPADINRISKNGFSTLVSYFLDNNREACKFVLRIKPERIHTFMPGLLIVNHIFKLFDSDEIIVSNFGVREGFLCHKILQTSATTNTYIPKIES